MAAVLPVLSAIGSVLGAVSTIKSLTSKPDRPPSPVAAPPGKPTPAEEIDEAETIAKTENDALKKRQRFLAAQRRRAVNGLLVGGQVGFPSSQLGQTGSTLGTG